ncbi:MAG: hypothetical protein U5K51_04330 [Flavobacteriaceae bacterium]|nr:hypothetical protein [Flavobacteriaceae bacterium]
MGLTVPQYPGLNIGSNNKIMAGMVLDKTVKDNEVVFYRFKEKVNDHNLQQV